jgi:hypothetical protein
VRARFRPKSNARKEQDRKEEDLQFGAVDTLEDERRVGGVDGMMWALPEIARFYGFHRDEVLEAWAKHYGLGFVVAALGASEGEDDDA